MDSKLFYYSTDEDREVWFDWPFESPEAAKVRWMKRHGYDKELTLRCPVAYWVKTGEPCD